MRPDYDAGHNVNKVLVLRTYYERSVRCLRRSAETHTSCMRARMAANEQDAPAPVFVPGPIPARMSFAGGPSVWLEFSPLARLCDAVNLGQGFPDNSPPAFVTEAARHCVADPHVQQYARSQGQPSLVQSIARHYGKKLGRDINPDKDVAITVGATEALFLIFNAFLDEGDEVIMIEPAFDIYRGAAAMCAAVVKSVPLRSKSSHPESSSELYIDTDELEAAFGPKTRLLVLNSPHNPTGKVFSRAEYEAIADVLRRHPGCAVASDEVYEHLVFDDSEHIPFATIPHMYERTLSIYSSGKTFSATGWKIGWVVGPAILVNRVHVLQQWVVFSVCTPLQETIALALDQAEAPYEGYPTYYKWLAHRYLERRELLADALRAAGLRPVMPQGSFFILADTSGITGDFSRPPAKVLSLVAEGRLEIDPSTETARDYNFARWLSTEIGVTPIPPSAFYCDANKSLGYNFARFAFCKVDDVLEEAANRLKKMNDMA